MQSKAHVDVIWCRVQRRCFELLVCVRFVICSGFCSRRWPNRVVIVCVCVCEEQKLNMIQKRRYSWKTKVVTESGERGRMGL